IRKCFRSRDFEYDLQPRLCNLRQHGFYHGYLSESQNLLFQCMEPISPVEQRFYFQQGLRSNIYRSINEKRSKKLSTGLPF
ncbi:hypothetical protein PHYSODRAFT_500028, partial [Phytophthora sojae]